MDIVYISTPGSFAWSADVDSYAMYHDDKQHHAVLAMAADYGTTKRISRLYRETRKTLDDLYRSEKIRVHLLRM